MSKAKATTKKETAKTKKVEVKKEVDKKQEPVKTKEDAVSETNEQDEKSGADKVSADTKASAEKTEEPKAASAESDIGNEEASSEVEEKGPTFVIPYLGTTAAGKELMYATRSIAHSFPDATIVVIGDKEYWFSDKIVHIEHKVESDNPQVDVAQKLLLAITAGALPEEFILTNDDIFLLGKTTLEDIKFLKAFGKIDNGVGKPGGVYNENAIRTLKALKKAKLGTIRYATHTPVMLNSDSLLGIINDLNADKEGHLLSSLYFNAFARDARPVQVDGGLNDSILVSVYRRNPNTEVVEKALKERKFMNTNDAGWPAVKPYLEKMYPEKSIFEA